MVPPRRTTGRSACPFVDGPHDSRWARHAEEPGTRARRGSNRPPPRASREPPTTSPFCFFRRAHRAIFCGPSSCPPLRRRRNRDAQHALGVLYLKGRGVSRDAAEAARWFERPRGTAARRGGRARDHALQRRRRSGGRKAGRPPVPQRGRKGQRHRPEPSCRLLPPAAACPQNRVGGPRPGTSWRPPGPADAWLDNALKDLSPDERTRAERLAAERSGLLKRDRSRLTARTPRDRHPVRRTRFLRIALNEDRSRLTA